MSVHSAVTPTDEELDARITRWGGWRRFVSDPVALSEHRAAARARLDGRPWWASLLEPAAAGPYMPSG